MKILLVGATGTIGRAVADHLSDSHDVVRASRRGLNPVDIRDPASIEALYQTIGPVDAVVCTAGGAPFVALPDATPADFGNGFADKLGGQINLVLHGLPHIRDNGSFTLITGILAHEPIATGTISATVNGGLESFVAAAATELPRGVRINAVSPTVVEEALPKYGAFFPGFAPTPAREVARAFVKSVEGVHTGRVYNVG
ncbi:short chain dehydrogenase [Nocardia sp. BMG51109]|uniref:short chain dehydrogenase n=1 Tax=Nocardia sp. BMG51109 TaxID=1056816 RepID=UPI000465400C|nr:short chain dehydrogenase [Nocardia sp. BMG51109]